MDRLESLPEEVAAVGAMVVVSAQHVDEVIGAFLQPETFEHVHQATRTPVGLATHLGS